MVLLVALAWWLVGATSTVTPPRDPQDPVTVLLVADGIHRGLLLPRPDGGYVEFGFGEWRWYAAGHDAWYRALPALLWPTAGALSRRLHRARDPAGVRAAMPAVEVAAVAVARAAAEQLRRDLERRFAAAGPARQPAAWGGLAFVPSERGYWLLATCADVVAEWLRQLGCAVSWVPVRVGLRVAG